MIRRTQLFCRTRRCCLKTHPFHTHFARLCSTSASTHRARPTCLSKFQKNFAPSERAEDSARRLQQATEPGSSNNDNRMGSSLSSSMSNANEKRRIMLREQWKSELRHLCIRDRIRKEFENDLQRAHSLLTVLRSSIQEFNKHGLGLDPMVHASAIDLCTNAHRALNWSENRKFGKDIRRECVMKMLEISDPNKQKLLLSNVGNSNDDEESDDDDNDGRQRRIQVMPERTLFWYQQVTDDLIKCAFYDSWNTIEEKIIPWMLIEGAKKDGDQRRTKHSSKSIRQPSNDRLAESKGLMGDYDDDGREEKRQEKEEEEQSQHDSGLSESCLAWSKDRHFAVESQMLAVLLKGIRVLGLKRVMQNDLYGRLSLKEQNKWLLKTEDLIENLQSQFIGLSLDKRCLYELISIYGLCGRIEKCEEYFNAVKNKDERHYGALIRAYARAGQVHTLHRFLKSELEKDVKILKRLNEENRGTINEDRRKKKMTAFEGQASDKPWLQSGGAIITQMVESSDAKFFETLMLGYFQSGEYSRCIRTFHEMIAAENRDASEECWKLYCLSYLEKIKYSAKERVLLGGRSDNRDGDGVQSSLHSSRSVSSFELDTLESRMESFMNKLLKEMPKLRVKERDKRVIREGKHKENKNNIRRISPNSLLSEKKRGSKKKTGDDSIDDDVSFAINPDLPPPPMPVPLSLIQLECALVYYGLHSTSHVKQVLNNAEDDTSDDKIEIVENEDDPSTSNISGMMIKKKSDKKNNNDEQMIPESDLTLKRMVLDHQKSESMDQSMDSRVIRTSDEFDLKMDECFSVFHSILNQNKGLQLFRRLKDTERRNLEMDSENPFKDSQIRTAESSITNPLVLDFSRVQSEDVLRFLLHFVVEHRNETLLKIIDDGKCDLRVICSRLSAEDLSARVNAVKAELAALNPPVLSESDKLSEPHHLIVDAHSLLAYFYACEKVAF